MTRRDCSPHVLVGIGLIILCSSIVSAAGTRQALDLFIQTWDTVCDPKLVTGHRVVRSCRVVVNPFFFRTISEEDAVQMEVRELHLQLFPDLSVDAILTRLERVSDRGIAWIGKIRNVPDSEVILAVSDQVIAGNVSFYGRLFHIRFDRDGIHQVQEIDPRSFPLERDPLPVDVGGGPEKIQDIAGDDGSFIDVLVVYTPLARTNAGGQAAIEAKIDLAAAETNTGYANSGVNQRIRLAHKAEVSYDEAGFDWSTALSRLQNPSDGYIDNVHTLRDTYQADEVVMIVSNFDYCGIGYLMTTVSTGFAPYSFCVVSSDCATGYYSFAHEMGHNMGSHHDRANASGPGAYSYSYGYQAPNKAFRTIMAYDCPGGCTRVNYWSNPNISYAGQPTGIVQTAVNSADNHMSLNNTAFTVANFRSSASPSTINLSKSGLFFGAVIGSVSTIPQTLVVSNGGGKLNWTASSSQPWLSVTPSSGTGTAKLTVSVKPSGLARGTYTGKVTIKAAGAANTPQTVSVTLKVYRQSSTAPPFGYFDTPVNGSTVMGSIPVSGWTLDDIEVTKVEIRRGPVTGDPPGAIGPDGLIYVGNATFVEGARPDVETARPGIPLNYRAGWGYLLLTYGLPAQGNGTFTLYAVAFDKDNHRSELGAKTIHSDNANHHKPFGAIDTPTQGGTVSGNPYVNFGWVLTPPPNKVPIDGSTIWLWIDGVQVGHPTYNQFRADVHDAYPDYLNADGAVGFYFIDTTAYANGMHTISWSAMDDHGQEEGMGSRFFWVLNEGARDHGKVPVMSPSISLGSFADLAGSAKDVLSPVYVRTGFRDAGGLEVVSPDAHGVRRIEIDEVDRVVVSLDPPERLPAEGHEVHRRRQTDRAYEKPIGNSCWTGYLVVSSELRSLPIGSTLDARDGVFRWQPGPGFIGTYRFVFLDGRTGSKKFVTMSVRSKKFPQKR